VLGKIYVADNRNNRVRSISPAGSVSTIFGNGAATSLDGVGTAATSYWPTVLAFDNFTNSVYIGEFFGTKVRVFSPYTFILRSVVSFGVALVGQKGMVISSTGTIYLQDGEKMMVMTCRPCPASYFCFSGAPVLCPAGSYCPLSSITAARCPEGSFSNAGASNCTLCPAGSYSSSAGSTSCQKCAGGHFCPAGTSLWAKLNCGRGHFCPDGSSAPRPCPYQVPPSGGWGALQVQGPAFLVETAHCLNHCFWNFTSGDGLLSKC
jgi:hypothetical protein